MKVTGTVLTLLLTFLAAGTVNASEPRHGLSLFGDLELPPDFTHFGWVNPDAQKGGTIRLGSADGNYDSLNPYILRGRDVVAATLIHDTLMERNLDEPSALYGRVAETVELADDFGWVEFHLRPQARFHDGHPMTVEDVLWTFDTLKEHGSPLIQMAYRNISHAEITGERSIRMHFTGLGRESAAAVSLMPVLARHYWADREFEVTTLEPPLGSGPYRIGRMDAGRNIVYERVEDYWGRDLPVNRGRFNFDEVRYDYFRDLIVMREIFKGGDTDWHVEFVAKDWARAYEFPGRERGQVFMEVVATRAPRNGDQIAINIRHTRFQDRRVREAINYIFPFELNNRLIWENWYGRTRSYFHGSELAHQGIPEGRELELLEPWRDQLDPRVFTQQYDPPPLTGEPFNRSQLRHAEELLDEAGWHMRDGWRHNDETGERLTVELLSNLWARERLLIPFAAQLRRVGIDASVRASEQNEYYAREQNFDFDMVVLRRVMSGSPGVELRDDFASASADQPYSDNMSGVQNPAVDFLIEEIINADTRENSVAATRALDRVLLWEFYMINGWVSPGLRIVYWDMFGRPDRWPNFGLGFPHSWWHDPVRAQRLEQIEMVSNENPQATP